MKVGVPKTYLIQGNSEDWKKDKQTDVRRQGRRSKGKQPRLCAKVFKVSLVMKGSSFIDNTQEVGLEAAIL